MDGRDDDKGAARAEAPPRDSSGERAAGQRSNRPPDSAGGYRDYVIKGEQGRGGLGRVLRAHDRRLDRQVAIKEILADGVEPDAASRFLREARLTAQLQHPSIVPVYEIGFREDGAPFYAMKLIVGESFDALIARTKSLDERLALLPNVLAVAEAIAYAHDRHIIHRDLKPSNVIVGAFGETVVIDWGVAKELAIPAGSPGISTRPGPDSGEPSADPSRGGSLSDTILNLGDASGVKTQAGRALGTLGYMPPEQFRGEEVDERADVFALGGFLYHTVTGVAPHADEPRDVALERIAQGDVLPIESREPAVPQDLAAIARKALSPAPSDRYATAKDLAADLRRFQTGQLVSAHVYSRRVLLQRWLGRNRRIVGTTAAFVIALGAMAVVSVRGVVRERDRAELERAKSEARAQELTLVQARTSLDRDPTASLAWLKTATFDEASRAEALSIAADARARGVARQLLPAPGLGELSSAVLSPDGSHVYAGPEQPGLVEWDLSQGERMRFLATPMTLWDPTPTRDGTHAITGSLEGPLLALDLTKGSFRVLSGHQGRAVVRVAPVGHHFASCGDDGTVRDWDLDTGAGRILGSHDGACAGVDFSPDATWLVTGGADRKIRFWDLRGGTGRVLPAGLNEVREVRWSPGGRNVVVIGDTGSRAIDVASGQSRVPPGDVRAAFSTFLPGTETFVAGDGTGLIHLWDLTNGGERLLRGHTASVNAIVAKSATSIVTCAMQEATRIWDLRSGGSRVLRGHTGLKDCRLARGGRALLSSGNDGMIRLWDLPDDDAERALVGHLDDVYSVRFSPDGSLIATGSDDSTVRIWNAASGQSYALEGHTDVVESAVFIDASHVASASDDRTVRVWDLADRSSFVLPHTMRAEKLIPTRDGRTLITTCQDGMARIWDLARREAVVLRGPVGATDFAALSPDEERVATESDDGTVRVWDRHTGAQLVLLNAMTKRITALEFVADGALVASSGDDGMVRLWDSRSGALVRTLTGHTDRVRSLAVSPDGRRLVSASNDRTARIWDVETGASLALVGHADQVRRAAFSPDGRWVVTAGYDGTTRIWDARTGYLLQLSRSDAPVMSAVVSPDGSLVASVGFDRMLHLVRIDPSRFMPSEAGAFRRWLDAMTTAVVIGAGRVASPVVVVK